MKGNFDEAKNLVLAKATRVDGSSHGMPLLATPRAHSFDHHSAPRYITLDVAAAMQPHQSANDTPRRHALVVF